MDTTLKIIERIEERVSRDKYVSTSELNGILREANAEGILLEYETKEKPEGAKRPVKVTKTEPYAFTEIKSVKETIIF